MTACTRRFERFVVLTFIACGTDPGPRQLGSDAGGRVTGADSTAGGDATGVKLDIPGDGASASQTGGAKLDIPDGDAAGTPDPECATYRESAELGPQPADIIFIVDNSGSMEFEATSVQNNLNAFSQQIAQSRVDARVVLLSSYPGAPEPINGHGICVDPPLGSGGCSAVPPTDNNPPLFTHVDQFVDSNDALLELLDHYSDWASVLRPNSALHIVVVSDDESDLDAAPFDSQFKALNPDFSDYTLHGIVSASSCDEAAEIGQVYIDLAQMTGGIISDLCDQNFQPVFDTLATQVVASSGIACQWALPAPPAGQVLNPNEVNVEFDDGTGASETIGQVQDLSACRGVTDGWYYDNPTSPTAILACPQTCARIQDATMASIHITLGCATLPAG